jgi:GTP-binding protein HflX
MSQHGTTAIVAKRTDERPADTTEIRALTESAGYEIVDDVTQIRTPDPDTEFGPGKTAEIAARVEETGTDVVIIDNDLDPSAAFALRDQINCEIIDRKRLVIEIFADRANTRRARLEVRLAQLRYELPLAEERAKRGEASGRMGFKSRGESPAERIRAKYHRQIRNLEAELDEIDENDDQRREDRHEAGFDLVALAGYTNAGKSTLLRRLADDLSIDENEEKHTDLDRTAESQDRLFTTLDTTTRRVSLDGRRLLLTDTVGFISGLPHWLVESFESTLTAAYTADAVCLVVDCADDTETIREKTETSMGVIREHRDTDAIPVLNKTDIATGIDEKQRIVREVAGADPVIVSALKGQRIGQLTERLQENLPDQQRSTVTLSYSDDGMTLLSWIHDHASVEDIEYGNDLTIVFSGRPEVVEQANGKARTL